MRDVGPGKLEGAEGRIAELDDGQKGGARKRMQRDPLRDLVIPIAAIAAVIAAIVVIQLFRGRADGLPPVPAADGDFYALGLGPSGGGKPNLGEPAPEFRLLDVQGQVVRLDDFRGRPVLLNFWASWCVPCRKEMPDLVDLQAEWGDRAQVVGVNYFESADDVAKFAADFSVGFPLPLDRDGRVTGTYKLTGLPETYFLDSEGVIRDRRIGQLRPDVARCIVDSLGAGIHEPEDCR